MRDKMSFLEKPFTECLISNRENICTNSSYDWLNPIPNEQKGLRNRNFTYYGGSLYYTVVYINLQKIRQFRNF